MVYIYQIQRIEIWLHHMTVNLGYLMHVFSPIIIFVVITFEIYFPEKFQAHSILLVSNSLTEIELTFPVQLKF